jgi:hypothetical protein
VVVSPHLQDTSLKYVDLNIALPKNRVRSSWLPENCRLYRHGNENISPVLYDTFIAELVRTIIFLFAAGVKHGQ